MSEEGALIARAAGGDVDAVGALVVAHRPSVVRIARHLLGDAAAAEDVAQEVFVRLHAALPGFRGDAALSTWLYRVTLNLCRDLMRRTRRRREDVGLEALGNEPMLPAMTVEAQADRSIDLQRLQLRVRAAVDRLPADQREAVLLRYMEELSYTDIAHLTDTPQGTVASRVFRALERLGRDLEPHHMEVVK